MTLYKSKDEIREYAKEHNLKECAEHFRVQYSTMSRFMKQYNIVPAKYILGMKKEEFIAETKGKDLAELSARFGVTRQKMASIMNYQGIPYKKQKRAYGMKAERNEMIVYLLQKYSCSSVSELLGISRQCVDQIYHLYGVGK